MRRRDVTTRAVLAAGLLATGLLAIAVGCGSTGPNGSRRSSDDTSAPLQSIAIRVHRTEAMVAFYEEAFGARFRVVDTFGVSSRFAEIDGITVKLVPIRESVDFDGYPSHQLGFEVPSIGAVLEAAGRHGGHPEGERMRDGDRWHAAVRDPDGNTIELYEKM